MHWFLLSILTAITVASRDVLVKKISKDHKAMEIAAIELFWSLPFFCIALLFIEIPELNSTFWLNFGLSLPLNWLSYFFYITALTIAPLSLTVPLLSFTPVFVIITGALILNEKINTYGLIGIVLIVISSYFLNFNEAKKGYWKPLAAIFSEKGSRLMFAVAFIFSIAGVIGKKAMINSSPLFFGFSFFFICNLSMLCGILLFTDVRFSTICRYKKLGQWLGSLFFLHIIFHCLAIMGTQAAYMISLKRTSILFTVILGWFLFKEEHFKFRGPAALMMFAGALLIAFWGD
nr:DMT family transporter [Desulfobulbaceae bacterium]